jgi:hypothetical protein
MERCISDQLTAVTTLPFTLLQPQVIILDVIHEKRPPARILIATKHHKTAIKSLVVSTDNPKWKATFQETVIFRLLGNDCTTFYYFQLY